MHILTLPVRCVIGPQDIIEPGDYAITDLNGADLIRISGQGQMTPLHTPALREFDETKDWNGKRILFQRAGGFGDLILMTPIFREIKRRWPACTIGVSTMRHYSGALKHLPFVDGILQYPLPMSEAEKFDAWIFYENAIEHNPIAEKIHMTDVFAVLAGLTGIENKQPAFQVSPSEIAWCMVQYPRVNGTRRLVIHPAASVPTRRYPIGKLAEIAQNFLNKKWEVFIIGAPNEVPGESKGSFKNLTEDNLTFRQTAAVVNNCDCLLGGDSAFIHVAAGLGVPAVGVYGAFPWSLRTAYSPSVTAIQGHCPVSPCFHHPNVFRKDWWPMNGPCAKTGECTALADIKPSQIITKIELVARSLGLVEVNNK